MLTPRDERGETVFHFQTVAISQKVRNQNLSSGTSPGDNNISSVRDRQSHADDYATVRQVVKPEINRTPAPLDGGRWLGSVSLEVTRCEPMMRISIPWHDYGAFVSNPHRFRLFLAQFVNRDLERLACEAVFAERLAHVNTTRDSIAQSQQNEPHGN